MLPLTGKKLEGFDGVGDRREDTWRDGLARIVDWTGLGNGFCKIGHRTVMTLAGLVGWWTFVLVPGIWKYGNQVLHFFIISRLTLRIPKLAARVGEYLLYLSSILGAENSGMG